jgi:hypothetical protein
MNRKGLGRFGVAAKTVLREHATDSDGYTICPECGTPVGRSLQGHEVAHPTIVDGADPEAIGDSLVVHGWKCERHSGYEVVMPTPVGNDAASAVHSGWTEVRVKMTDGFVRTVAAPAKEIGRTAATGEEVEAE